MKSNKIQKIINNINKNLSDEELEAIIDKLSALADVFIEQNKEILINVGKNEL